MEPRVPFTAAEEVIDWDAHQEHIVDRRQRVEVVVWQDARTVAQSIMLHEGVPSAVAVDRLEARLYAALAGTYLFGYRSAVQEIRALRARKEGRRLVPSPSGNPPREHLREVLFATRQGAGAFCVYVVRAWESREEDWAWLERRSRQLLHNVVLELIGRILNLGRTHAALGGEIARHALTAAEAPTLWAMRSEQLDTNTCGSCEELHGRIVELLSPEYLELLPPTGCLGRGRCRGIMVFADDPADLSPTGQLRIDESIA